MPLILINCSNTISFFGRISDVEVPEAFEDVLVLALEVDVEVDLQEVVDHGLEGLEIRQLLVPVEVPRPEELFVRFALDEAPAAFDEDLSKISKN